MAPRDTDKGHGDGVSRWVLRKYRWILRTSVLSSLLLPQCGPAAGHFSMRLGTLQFSRSGAGECPRFRGNVLAVDTARPYPSRCGPESISMPTGWQPLLSSPAAAFAVSVDHLPSPAASDPRGHTQTRTPEPGHPPGLPMQSPQAPMRPRPPTPRSPNWVQWPAG